MDRIKEYLSNANIDFVGKRRPAAMLSIGMVVVSWVLLFFPGPNWGIDFEGGSQIHLDFLEVADEEFPDVDPNAEPVTIGEIRGVLKNLGLGDDAVQAVGTPSDHQFKVRIRDTTFGSQEMKDEVVSLLEARFGDDWIDGEPLFEAQVGARLNVLYNGERIKMSDAKEALAGMDSVLVEEGRDDNEIVVKLPGLSDQIQRKIALAMDKPFRVLAVDAVGPKVGGELRRQGFISLAATLALVLLYIGFRFDIGFAPGAIVALIHDVSVVVGIFVLFRIEFNLPIVGALLTIVGYSLNDTIVIYDRIRENKTRYRRKDLPDLINTSVNETLARTVATSVTTLLAISAFLFLGGPVIQTFALAMVLGVIFGTYSTVFVASPMILVMEDLKPYLSGLIALPQTDDEIPTEITEAALSESEKRRRERAKNQAVSQIVE